jgi:hypothetical protein
MSELISLQLRPQLIIHPSLMSIFRVIGFGLFIITLRLLLPDVLQEGRSTTVAFLRGAHLSADTATAISASALQSYATSTHSRTTAPPLLPQAPSFSP